MLVLTNTRCAPPELYRETGFAAARLLENELRDSVRQFTRSGYKCPNDTKVAGAVAEKFFRRRRERKTLLGERLVTDNRHRTEIRCLKVLSRSLSASRLRWGKQRKGLWGRQKQEANANE